MIAKTRAVLGLSGIMRSSIMSLVYILMGAELACGFRRQDVRSLSPTQSRNPGFEPYQCTSKTNNRFDPKRLLVMGALGTKQLGVECIEVFKGRLIQKSSSSSLKLRTDRLVGDLGKVAIIVGSQILKQPVLNYAIYMPHAFLPSTYFSSDRLNVLAETRIHQRLQVWPRK